MLLRNLFAPQRAVQRSTCLQIALQHLGACAAASLRWRRHAACLCVLNGVATATDDAELHLAQAVTREGSEGERRESSVSGRQQQVQQHCG